MKTLLKHPAFLVFAPHAAYVPFNYVQLLTKWGLPGLNSVVFLVGVVLWAFAWYLTLSVTGAPKLKFGWLGSLWSGSYSAGENLASPVSQTYRPLFAFLLALCIVAIPAYFALEVISSLATHATHSLPDEFHGAILNLIAAAFVVVTSGSVEKITGIKGGNSLADRIDRINAQAIEAKNRIDAIPGLDPEIKENMKMQIDVKREEDLKRALEGEDESTTG